MARYNTNRYQYETSPKKLQPEYTPIKKKYPRKSTVNKTNISTRKHTKEQDMKNTNIKIILTIGIIFAILFAISYRNALIAQEYSKIKNLKVELSEIEKENKQLEVNIESKTNLNDIEKKGEEKLGLKKLDDSQTIYMYIDKQDYVESSIESIKLENESSWLYSIINKIKNIF